MKIKNEFKVRFKNKMRRKRFKLMKLLVKI